MSHFGRAELSRWTRGTVYGALAGRALFGGGQRNMYKLIIAAALAGTIGGCASTGPRDPAADAFAISQLQRMNTENLQRQAMSNQMAIAQMQAMRPAPIQSNTCVSMPVGNFINTSCY